MQADRSAAKLCPGSLKADGPCEHGEYDVHPVRSAAQDQGFAQYVCVVDDCEIITEVPASELPAPNPECPVHEHEMLLAGWRSSFVYPA